MTERTLLFLASIILYSIATIMILIWFDVKLLFILCAWSYATILRSRRIRRDEYINIIRLINGMGNDE